MGQALYRKYRSKSLDEIVGQTAITTTLKRALATGKISHAYLFTGPRGVGKTSIARIVAHEINGIDYVTEDTHLDIIEIDAASNRGIEEIRDLRDKVHVAPSIGKYKVYIIDEVHMLTTPAFNALLKTLEEPPVHVVFILATTESRKLPETIISRTQHFHFKPVDAPVVIAHLTHIAQTEGITISDEALELIAAHGEGSFRDSIGLLDQASSMAESIDAALIEQLLGVPSVVLVDSLETAIAQHNTSEIITLLHTIQTQGFQAAATASQLSARLRQGIITHTSKIPLTDVTHLLRELLAVGASPQPDRLLEIVLLEATDQPGTVQPKVNEVLEGVTPPAAKIHPLPAEVSPLPSKIKSPIAEPILPSKGKPPAAVLDTVTKPTVSSNLTVDEAHWSQIILALKQKYNTLYSIIRMAQPTFEPGKVTLAFAFAFHSKRINDVKNKRIISDVIAQQTGSAVEIICVHDKTAHPVTASLTTNATEHLPDASLIAINTIFGGGELLP
jgi:DNA polymerase-3 subunit gamma/tau